MRENTKYTDEEIISTSKRMVGVINLFRQEAKEHWKGQDLIDFARGKVSLYNFIPSILFRAGLTVRNKKEGLSFVSNNPINYKDISHQVKEQVEKCRAYCAKNLKKKQDKKEEAPEASTFGTKIDVQYCLDFLKNRMKELAQSINEKKAGVISLMNEGDLNAARNCIEDIQKLEEERISIRLEVVNI